MVDDERVKIKLNDVWRTCNKIRTAIFRIGINLWDFFKKLDPQQNRLISETKFITVIGYQLRNTIGLSEQEITELADYFRVQDGRIAYHQFCDVIHTNQPDHVKNDDFVTALEWEDPLHENRLSACEKRRISVMMMKIAQTVRLRELVLRPYFQDYEMIAKNAGTVTLAHFARVLHFLGIILSAEDYLLLVKRFIKDSYTVNYVAFVDEIEKIVQYLDTRRLIDYSDDIKENFPGKLINAELPKLPRPEIGRVNIANIFGKESSYHPVLAAKAKLKNVEEIVLRIKRHVLDNSLRVNEYFQDFDHLRSGYIAKAQFLRGLDALGVSGLHRLYLWKQELENLCWQYADSEDPSRVDWKTFETDVEEVFTKRCLDKKPYEIVESPPQKVAELPKDGRNNWHTETGNTRNLCEEAVFKCKARISKRQLYLEPFFKAFDKLNRSHVTRSQMRQVLNTNAGILLSDEELFALEKRYNDSMGFSYMWFLKEADPQDYAIPKIEEMMEKMREINAPKKPKRPTNDELDIVQVLAKTKAAVVRKRIRILDYMEHFDCHNELCIVDSDFRRGLNSAGVELSEAEVDLICHVFKSPLRENFVDYKRFCQIVEEAFYQQCLERAPLIVPLQHFPSTDGRQNFLNFKERNILANALEMLARYADQISNLSSLFADYDRTNSGVISQNQFLRALTIRGLNNIISSHEFQIVYKCFAVQRGLSIEFDYRQFLRNLDILHEIRVSHPF